MKLFTLFNKYLFCIYYAVLGTFLVLGKQWWGGGKTQNKQTQHYIPVCKRYNSRNQNKKEINGIFQVTEGLCIKNNNTKVIEYNMWSEKSFLSCAK